MPTELFIVNVATDLLVLTVLPQSQVSHVTNLDVFRPRTALTMSQRITFSQSRGRQQLPSPPHSTHVRRLSFDSFPTTKPDAAYMLTRRRQSLTYSSHTLTFESFTPHDSAPHAFSLER